MPLLQPNLKIDATPFRKNTVLLLHGDGINGSTTLTDDGVNNYTITAFGNCQLDTSESKFGTASILFDGIDDYATVPDNSDWDLNQAEWQMDFWANFDDISTGRALITKYGGVSDRAWRWWWNLSNSELRFEYTTDGVTAQILSFSWVPVINIWYLVTLSKDANGNVRAFIDGAQVGATEDLSSVTIYSNNEPLVFGATHIGGGSYTQDFDGNLDDVRIMNKCQRKANFTPPIGPFPNGT